MASRKFLRGVAVAVAVVAPAALTIDATAHDALDASIALSDDGKSLAFTLAGHRIQAPRTQPDQEGFSKAAASTDGEKIAWLALTANCCTSYPLPTAVVVFDRGRVIRQFAEAPPIWQWAFANHDTAIAYRQAFPHGPVMAFYTLRRIADGKVLAAYECSDEGGTPRPVPAWVAAIAGGCPA